MTKYSTYNINDENSVMEYAKQVAIQVAASKGMSDHGLVEDWSQEFCIDLIKYKQKKNKYPDRCLLYKIANYRYIDFLRRRLGRDDKYHFTTSMCNLDLNKDDRPDTSIDLMNQICELDYRDIILDWTKSLFSNPMHKDIVEKVIFNSKRSSDIAKKWKITEGAVSLAFKGIRARIKERMVYDDKCPISISKIVDILDCEEIKDEKKD